MNYYSAYSLVIKSEVKLNEYKESISKEPDIEVSYTTSSIKNVLKNKNISYNIDGGKKGVKGHVGDSVKFMILNGSNIIVSGDDSVSLGLVRSLVQGVFMAVVLRQRGYLVLHSCGLAKDNFAFGFAGHASWGKSTLAAYFAKRGYTLLGDDILAIDRKGDALSVLPGSSVTRLRPHAAKKICPEKVQKNKDKEKYQLNFEHSYDNNEYSLRSIFILEESVSHVNSAEIMEKKESILGLVEHTRVRNLMTKSTEMEQNLSDCSYVARNIPIYNLKRKWGHSNLEEIYEEVEEKLSYNKYTKH